MLALLVALSCGAGPTAKDLFVRHECHRCHEIDGVAPPTAQKQCAGCHLELAGSAGDAKKLEQGHATYGDAFDRFIRRTQTLYVDVPPLASLSRFRASWLRSFLQSPYDLRPHLAESMPRLALTPADVEVLVKGLAKDAPPPTPSAERLERGAALFEARACTTCHLFGNRRFPTQPAALFDFKRPAERLLARAPDLRHVRDRLNRDVVVKLVLAPRSVNPRAQMPALGLSRGDAELLADFVLAGDVGALVEPPVVAAVTAPKQVRYEDVEERVFRKVCWHCHSNADFADGEGGPGNTGGFGFPALGLSFATYDELMNGSIGPDGEYRSIFRKGSTGEPVLLEVLKKRVHENARDFVKPGLDSRARLLAPPDESQRGMPLGLPAVEPADLALVEAWIVAGKPRPSTPPGAMLTPMGK